MSFRSRLKEFVVKTDLVPYKNRWTESVDAVGGLYRNVFNILDGENRLRLTKMMEEWGCSHANEALEKIGAKRDLHGCAVTLLAFHRIFGMKSEIVKETENEIAIHVTKCMWKDKKGWNPAICSSIEAYENGLVKGIDKGISHVYTTRRSNNDKVCEMILRK
jgi:hypothetical protein